MSRVLQAKNLVKRYGDFYAVNDIDLNLHKGEVVGLLGPNGAGKTTTFYMITGMIRPSSGRIIFGDEDITKSPMYKRARMGIGYLAQEPSIFGKLSVEDNLKIVLETIIPDKDEQDELINQLLNEFNISHIRDNLGAGLSGGERRRVEICRTLALKPDFVLLDEPFAGVDPIAVEDIQQMIISLKKQISIVPGSGLCACGLKGFEASCKLIFCVPNLRDFRFALSVDDKNSCNSIPKTFE